MNMEKLVPWNWFRKEQENQGGIVPVGHGRPNNDYAAALDQLHRDFEYLFDSFYRSFGFSGPPAGNGWSSTAPSLNWLKPTLDISASGKEYAIAIELPGVEQQDVQIDLAGDTLTIRGEKRGDREASDKDYYCVERSYGAFQRQLTLPEDADKDGITASFDNGIMTVTIPRVESAAPKTKHIEVKTAA